MEEDVYRKMYLRLFNRVTDAIAVLEQAGEREASTILILAQRESEQMFIDGSERK